MSQGVATNTVGGKIDHRAVIGHAPESREWVPGMPTHGVAIGVSARVEAFVTVDAGMERTTEIGARTWLMKGVHVGHDAQIGADCELAPRTVLGGHVTVGNGVRFGIGALVLPHRTIGDGARIGAGAVVTKDVPAGEVWAGNPAKRIGPKCSKCGGSGLIHFMNMHPEDYEPPMPCPKCNQRIA